MARILRQDRMLLESLEDKYGTDAIAQVIMSIANKDMDQVEEESISPQEAVLDYIKYIEGVRIRLREIHWETDVHSKHILTDDMIGSLEDFEDNIAEDLMGMCGFRLKVGSIVPTMTTQVDLGALLCELDEATVQLCACIENNDCFKGIVNEIEDLLHKIGKWKYLATFK